MSIESMVYSLPNWLNEEGPEDSVVISSRARLARNIKGYVYAHRAGEKSRAEIVDLVVDAAPGAGFDSSRLYRNDGLDERGRMILAERHLISPALASRESNAGVLLGENENSSVMINEEDHLRIQSLTAGFDPDTALSEAIEMARKLGEEIPFSLSPEFGYLTACPTNMGSGLRISVLMHLPALVMSNEIQKVLRSTSQIGFSVRGHRGEGSDVVGNMFQISNQKSFGLSESEILEKLKKIVATVIEYEKHAANFLMREASERLLDKIWRSVGILKTARVLSSLELINLLSAVRFGLSLGVLDTPLKRNLNELMILTQPAHLQARHEENLASLERDKARADIVRERFVDVSV